MINGKSVHSDYTCSDSILEISSLSWGQQFKNYDLKIDNISDFNGNYTGVISISGVHVNNSFKSLLLTEVLPDPDRNTIYSEEFIEIYNSGKQKISLKGFSICDFTKCVNLPELDIDTSEVMVFSGSAEGYSNSVIVSGLPSLNNSGDKVFLKFEEVIVDSLSYSDKTFHSLDLPSSGTALKRRFKNFLCAEEFNMTGGEPDPGIVNFESVPEKLAEPKITFSDYNSVLKIKADILSDNSNLNLFIEDQSIQFDVSEEIVLEGYKIYHLNLNRLLNPNHEYTIKISDQKNCLTGEVDSVLFEDIKTLDDSEQKCLKVSEFMFDPETGKSDFIEVYNECDGAIEISNYKFIFMDHNQIVDDTIAIEEEFDEYHLGAKSVALLYSEDNELEDDYEIKGKPLKIKIKDFINLRNTGGYFEIFRRIPGGEVKKEIERSAYFENWHSEWLEDTEGVSLERFNFEGNSADKSVWKSASELSNYSTPGIISGFSQNVFEGEITIQPKVIIPGDPYYGEQTINVKTDNTAKMVSVELFSLSGKLVKTLCLDCYVSGSITLRWEGIKDSGQVINPGHYILRVTYISNNGIDDIIIKPLAVGL
nr:lamin tail domain-containing protein [Mangrovivirga halotolerans]